MHDPRPSVLLAASHRRREGVANCSTPVPANVLVFWQHQGRRAPLNQRRGGIQDQLRCGKRHGTFIVPRQEKNRFFDRVLFLKAPIRLAGHAAALYILTGTDARQW